MADLTNIKHIVVLMLENRSFDNIFGFLRPAGPDFDGLSGAAETGNPAPDGSTLWPWMTTAPTETKTIPTPDPGEKFDDLTQQIYNGGLVTQLPSMKGFANNYYANGGTPNDIMHCFAPTDLPALSQLATSYAVSDRWFASELPDMAKSLLCTCRHGRRVRKQRCKPGSVPDANHL